MRHALTLRTAILACVILPISAMAQAQPDPLAATGKWSIDTVGNAPTPPMGWNSWNAFGTDVNEDKVVGAAKSIVEDGLAAVGYTYINIDDGWWLKRRQSDGRLLIRTNLFPSAKTGGKNLSNFRPFTDKIHKMGLKTGIYTDIGHNACSQAYNLSNPNLPEGTALEREVGTYGHVVQDMALFFQDWGFDYVKVDACGISGYGEDRPVVKQAGYRPFAPLIIDNNVNQSDIAAVKTLYGTLRDTLVRLNPDKDFILSICNWGTANVRSWGKNYGNLWRTSGDIQANWPRMLHVFDTVVTRELYAGPGRWNDPDMLFVGHGDFDLKHLTEAKTHFALWAIAASPLIIGYDLRGAPKELLDIWRAPEIVAVNQDKAGNQGVLAYSGDDVQIIVKTLGTRGEKAVALFNRSAAPVSVQLTAEHLKMTKGSAIALRDLWARAEIGSFTDEKAFTLQPHETLMLKANGKPVLETGLYLSEMPGRINVAADGIIALEADPMIHRMIDPWGSGTRSSGQRPEYAGWGGPRADSTPYDETLRLRNQSYRSGIGALANSRLEVQANGNFKRFTATVGIDDSSRGKTATVTFEVYADGKRVAASDAAAFNKAPMALSADVSGARIVELVARQQGSDTGPVIVAWADAALQ
jgi:alpha-galactosidase